MLRLEDKVMLLIGKDISTVNFEDRCWKIIDVV
jgi:hypothetical protein